MKKLALMMLLIFNCAVACGDEWVPYVEIRPIQPVVTQYYNPVPYYYSVPIVVQPAVVPVTIYRNVIVERKEYCWFKRYEIVPIPQTVYVPYRY